MRVGVVLAGAIVVSLLVVTPASARIVIGQGVGGVKVGESIATVKKKLGKPTSDKGKRPRVLYYKRRHLQLSFTPRGKLFQIVTFNKHERTKDGIGPGAPIGLVEKLYPDACTMMPGHCAIVTTAVSGRQVSTQIDNNGGRGKLIETVKILLLLSFSELQGGR